MENKKHKPYTFQQQLSCSYINSLQESVKKTDVLVAFSTDHLQITFSLSSKSQGMRGKGLRKHNNTY